MQEPTGRAAPDVTDAITAETIANALAVAVEEASIVVVRSSHSAFIQEGADACAALLDAEGQLVAQSASTSLMHGASLRCSLPALLEDVDPGHMQPGDVYALNDPFRGGIHANDIVVFRPIFAAGRPRWFAGTLIHVADVGGSAAGGLAAVADDTFAEGLLLPPVRLLRAGEEDSDVLRIIARNSRVPAKVEGDVLALVAGVHTIARRVDELVGRYGADPLAAFAAAAMDRTERRVRQEIDLLPDGTYSGRFTIDTDGVSDRRFEVRAEVVVDGDRIVVDLAGSAAQSGGAINASASQTLSGVLFAVRCLIDPTIPMDEGCFRPVEVRLPAGTVVNPNPPAACGGRIVTVAATIDAVLDALSGCRPDRGVAPSGLVQVFTLTGLDAAGARWITLLYEFGGIGARRGSDGPDATGAFFLGGRSVIPQVEPLESQFPFVVRRTRLRPDSGGPGRWRGGLGVETEIELLVDTEIGVRGDRMLVPPPGAEGGSPGAPGGWSLRRTDGTVEELATRQAGVRARAGDVFVLRTSGGGGLGPPAERDPAAVRADVARGDVTAAAAARHHGVDLDAEAAR